MRTLRLPITKRMVLSAWCIGGLHVTQYKREQIWRRLGQRFAEFGGVLFRYMHGLPHARIVTCLIAWTCLCDVVYIFETFQQYARVAAVGLLYTGLLDGPGLSITYNVRPTPPYYI